MKKLSLYCHIFNEERILPDFLDYYKFVDKMTFIDSGSTDKSLEIIKKFKGCEVEIIETGLKWFNMELLQAYKNEIWKLDPADLILFPDCDEIFYHEDLRGFLERTDYDVYVMEGYEMLSEIWPKGNVLEIKHGVRSEPFDKPTIFKPTIKISFPNAHIFEAETKNINKGDIKLLHYRYLSLEAMQKRRDREKERTPEGYLGIRTDEQLIEYQKELFSKIQKVI